MIKTNQNMIILALILGKIASTEAFNDILDTLCEKYIEKNNTGK